MNWHFNKNKIYFKRSYPRISEKSVVSIKRKENYSKYVGIFLGKKHTLE
jgi:hypothetical protein